MAVLVVDSGADKGRKLVLRPGVGDYVLGRDETAHLHIRDRRASRGHCRIRVGEDGEVLLEDLESRNGTLLNGVQVSRTERLSIGDQVQIGDTVLTLLAETPDTHRTDSMEGRELSGYRILERVGGGGMGTVYRAVQKSLHREVALKILSRATEDNQEEIRIFVQEARAAGQLNHPHIIQVYDVGRDQEEGVWFFSMEYAARGSILDVLAAQGSLSPQEAAEVITQAARGLLYAEQKGIVHRDIKPDNLMVTADGHVKIGDLGLAGRSGGTAHLFENGQGTVFGTPHYIAPEQAQGKAVDHRADLYSLGATFYRLVAGRPPFEGQSAREIVRKQVTEEPPPLAEVAPEVPRAMARIIETLMQKRPEDRYQSAGALLRDLERISRRTASTSRRVLRVGGLLVLLLAAAGLLLVMRGKNAPVDPGRGSGLAGTGSGNGDTGAGGGPRDPNTGTGHGTELDPLTGSGPLSGTATQAEPLAGPLAGTAAGQALPADDLDREEAARQALQQVASQELSVQLLGADLLQAYEAVAQEHQGTTAAADAWRRAGRLKEEVDRQRSRQQRTSTRSRAARVALQTALDRARPLLEQNRFGEALEALDAVTFAHPDTFAGSEAAPGFAERWRAQARAEFDVLCGQAATRASEKDFSGAVEVLQIVLERFGLPALAQEARELVRRYRTEGERHQEMVHRACLTRDQERLRRLEESLSKSVGEAPLDMARLSRIAQEAAGEFELSQYRDLVLARAQDYRSAGSLLTQLDQRYDAPDGLLLRTLPAPEGQRGLGSTVTLTAPGEEGHQAPRNCTYSVWIRNGKARTTLSLDSYAAIELLELLPRLWAFTPLDRLHLASLAISTGQKPSAVSILETLRAELPEGEVRSAATAMLERLAAGDTLGRELEARSLYDEARLLVKGGSHEEALPLLSRLESEYGDTRFLAGLPSKDHPTLAQLRQACTEALSAAAAQAEQRRYQPVSLPKVRQEALRNSREYLLKLERGSRWLDLARAYEQLESFSKAAQYYMKFVDTYGGTDNDEIQSGRVFLAMARCALFDNQGSRVEQLLERAGSAPKVDRKALQAFQAFRAAYPVALTRAQVLEERRKQEKYLPLAESRELVDLYDKVIPLHMSYRAELLAFIQNYREQLGERLASYEWDLIDSYWDLEDSQAVAFLGPRFIQDHPTHRSVTEGELHWRTGESLRRLEYYSRALTYYQQLKRDYPQHDRVRNRSVDNRIERCEKKLR